MTSDSRRTETSTCGSSSRASDDQPDQDRAVGWLIGCMAHEATPADARNIRSYALWMMAWGGVTIVDAEWFGATRGMTSSVTVGLALASVAILAGVVISFTTYVRETDELNRSIQLRSVAAGFGAGFVTAMVAEAAEDAGLVDRVDVDVPAVAMLVTYAVASVLITRSYR